MPIEHGQNYLVGKTAVYIGFQHVLRVNKQLYCIMPKDPGAYLTGIKITYVERYRIFVCKDFKDMDLSCSAYLHDVIL